MEIGWLFLAGVALLGMAVLPRLLAGRPLTLPILYVAIGWAAVEFVEPIRGPRVGPGPDDGLVLAVSELVVIISLVAVGLSLERRPGLVSWGAVWRLLAVAMPLGIGLMALAGQLVLGLGGAAAILLGAVLAPTDPVLADDIQVPGPGDEEPPEPDEVRFTLTAEAGLNDSLAFPFTHLALVLAAVGWSDGWVEWVAVDVVQRLAIGTVAGLVLGRLLTSMLRRFAHVAREGAGLAAFVAGATLTVYAVTELLHGYGFLAVFLAALSRHDEIEELRPLLHAVADQFETVLVAVILIGIGAAVAEGVLDPLGWEGALVAAGGVLVLRPVVGVVSLWRSPLPMRERAAIGFLGIKGLGTVFYLAYATVDGAIPGNEIGLVWAVAVATILTSVVVHGLTATPIVDRHNQRDPQRA